MSLPKRKLPRMKGFDYATPTAYFVTICTHNKKCIFGQPAFLNQWGKQAQEAILRLPVHFPDISVEKYVVMPNHIHMLLFLKENNHYTVSDIVGAYKSEISRSIHQQHAETPVWQKSFHDHIIRTQTEWEKIWNYIELNPEKWNEDCFYHP